MPLWNYTPHRIVSLIDPDQYRCLTAQNSEVYLAILTELYRSRHEELLHELPFETLYERVAPLERGVLPCQDLLRSLAESRIKLEQEVITAEARYGNGE